ncbi:MAG: hypothetical protein GY737_30070 [Desulfobacteraceae bacterium]|nr:hypothetical protein [Desulfobacteraceae bacterium]
MKKNRVKIFMIILCLFAEMMFIMPVQSAPLGLNLDPPPDIESAALAVNYLEAIDQLSVSGSIGGLSPMVIDYATGIDPMFMGVFNLEATIDENGDFYDGSLLIGDASGNDLLTGNITAFGFSGSGSTALFEFLFDVGVDNLREDFGDIGGVLLCGSQFTGDFGVDFIGDDQAYADTEPIPEPAVFGLLIWGIPGLYVIRRLKNKLG